MVMGRAKFQGIKNAVDICRMKGIRHCVVSPGSRNAPISILFSKDDAIQVYTIVDERSAAFFALGIAQQLNMPVALVCTSGTAALNYAPAIAEAYYQQVPLLVLTADRPSELLDTSDGQMINQNELYRNIVIASYTLPFDGPNDVLKWHQQRIVNEAIDKAKIYKRPVHINVPLRVPLYELDDIQEEVQSTSYIFPITQSLPDQEIVALANQWNKMEKVMIVIGCNRPDVELNEILNGLNGLKNLIIVSETTSNVIIEKSIGNVDIAVASIGDDKREAFKPDLLITFGTNLISKPLKLFLRKHKTRAHWHLSPILFFPDSYRALSHKISIVPKNFFKAIQPYLIEKESEYKDVWLHQQEKARISAKLFIETQPYCDLKVLETITNYIPEGSNLQMGNSTPVRYIQQFQPRADITYNSNRGTSGIDGCVSTAMGASTVNSKPMTLIVGDLSFMYDNNALWSAKYAENLKIIVINNQGGGIFKFIEGPDKYPETQELQVAPHKHDFEHLAYHYKIPYQRAASIKALEGALEIIYKEPGLQILEVITPGEINGQILRNFFKTIKQQ